MELTPSNQRDFLKQNQKPTLGSYTDYRVYLKDFLDFKKSLTANQLRPYSYSHFSAAANIKSPNYLKLIIEGKRNLSSSMTKKFSMALNHNKKEAEEFDVLVSYCQSKEPLERNAFLKTLSEMRMEKKINIGELDKKSLEDAPSWLSWVLLSLGDQKNVQLKAEEIKKVIKRNISLTQIEKSLNQLKENGDLVFNDETKSYEKQINTNHENQSIPAEMVRKLQTELVYLGLESLFQDPPEEREFGTVSLCLTQREFEELKFDLRHLRKKIYKENLIQRENSKGDKVYQLNLQLFPLTE